MSLFADNKDGQSTMIFNEEDQRRVALALDTAAFTDGLSGSDVVFNTIKDMLDIDRRMHVPVGNRRVSSMPWIGWLHTQEETYEIFKQRMLEVAAGEPMDVVFGFRIEATPEDVATLEAVHRIFRSLLVGRNRDRDWRILHKLAEYDMISPRHGRVATLRSIAKEFRLTKESLTDRKKLQCAAIWSKVGSWRPVNVKSKVLRAA